MRAALSEEALLDDAAEAVGSCGRPGSLSVVAGFGRPCPDVNAVRNVVRPGGGPVQLFAVERRDGEGRLRSATWVAVPDEEPPDKGSFRAAVLRESVGG